MGIELSENGYWGAQSMDAPSFSKTNDYRPRHIAGAGSHQRSIRNAE